MLYKITNLLSTSVTIGDLGLHLAAHASCSVRAEAWARSADAAELEAKRWVRADKQWVDGQAHEGTITTRKQSAVLVPQDPPVSQSQIKTPSVAFQPVAMVPTVSIPQDSFDRFLKNQEEMMKMMMSLAGTVPEQYERMAKILREMPAPAVVPYRPGMTNASDFSPAARGADPMFIPSKIVPDLDQSSIKVTEGEVSTDVGGSVDALRKARGKKPESGQ